jgi:pyruvate/2-oxoglutarate/acetoin dehydrogenase E1 component
MHEQLLRQLNFVEAIREGLDLALTQDPSVLVIGEGVPDPKAIFSSTAGLLEKHGPHRIFDMPLAENGLTGVCIGAAISGMRPVMIHQRIDFAMLAMDQIVNNAAKWHYIFDGKAHVPIVIRMIVGRGWGQGPQHSQSLQAMFASVPGLKVVMPTTAADAKGLLISAIEDDNPVIFIEHRWLHHIIDNVPEGMYRTPIGKARILHEGGDVTIAAFSYMSLEALEAAKALKEHMNISVDLLDMRSVRPLDISSVICSVGKTAHLMVADTAFKTGSIAGEVISQVVEQAFSLLKKAPVRIASPDHPVPTSQFMAAEYYPDPLYIAESVVDLVGASRDTAGFESLRNALIRLNRHDVPNQNFSGPF